MERYTIADVELIRSKSGISYEDAVKLLDFHNGDIAQALIDLERNGRIIGEKSTSANKQNQFKEKVTGFVQKLRATRFIVKKQERDIVNLSLLVVLVLTVFFPYAVLALLAVVFILGYRVRILKEYANNTQVDVNKMFKTATTNMKETFNDIKQELKPDAPSAADAFEKVVTPVPVIDFDFAKKEDGEEAAE